MILPKLKFKIHPFFPHIFRIIPALTLWLIIITILILNLFHSRFFGFNPVNQISYLLLEYPHNPFYHQKLGSYYLKEGIYKKSQQEFAVARQLSIEQNSALLPEVLGISATSKDEEIKYWLNINSYYPDYIYAPLKLAADFIEVGNFIQAQKYIHSVLLRDPINKEALNLEKLLAP